MEALGNQGVLLNRTTDPEAHILVQELFVKHVVRTITGEYQADHEGYQYPGRDGEDTV